jgi:hypothetical protein
MTVNKGFKRLVRERMAQTGQSYMQAREDMIREREAAQMGRELGEAAKRSMDEFDASWEEPKP